MRLWHQNLIPILPRQQLLGQHRECCALRGNGWGKKHSVVNYVFKHSPIYLFQFHTLVMIEMIRRGYNVEPAWLDCHYRGAKCPPHDCKEPLVPEAKNIIYDEHDQQYLIECIQNLQSKFKKDWLKYKKSEIVKFQYYVPELI